MSRRKHVFSRKREMEWIKREKEKESRKMGAGVMGKGERYVKKWEQEKIKKKRTKESDENERNDEKDEEM